MTELLSYINQRVPTLLIVIGIILASIVIARRIRVLVRSTTTKIGLPEEISNLIGSASYIVALVVGLAIALAQGGWSTAASSFLAGLGITSIIIGMAVQDIFRSYTSGIMLLYHRPYQVGDEVTIANIRGTVTAIRMHVTILRNVEGSTISIPSNAISANAITNHTRSGLRRLVLQLTIPRGSQTEHIINELPALLQRTPDIAPEPAPTIGVVGLNNDGISIGITFWATADAETSGTARSNAILTVDQFMNQPNISIK